MAIPDHLEPAIPAPGEPLDRARCLALLATAPLGRVSLSIDALPVIIPVGFRLAGERIIFGAQAAPRAVAAIDGVVVAFAADRWDECVGEGWSVLVQGPARRLLPPGLGDRSALELDSELGLVAAGDRPPAWVAQASTLVVVDTDVISGCTLVPATAEFANGVGGRPFVGAISGSGSGR